MLLLGLIFILITIVGLIGNSMVIFVLSANKQIYESTSIFICNLALADLLFVTFCVPITAYSYLYSWQFSPTICYITVLLQYVTCYVSVWTLVLLAYDRFISITTHGVSKSMRRAKTVVYVCLAVWMLTFALNVFQMRNVGLLSFEYNNSEILFCVDNKAVATNAASPGEARSFYWGFNLLAYVFPLATSCVFYFLLVRVIWRQKVVQSKSSQRIKRHATKMVFVVILTFALCWFPQNARFFLRGLSYPDPSKWETVLPTNVLLWVQCTIQVIAYANSCVNPILYGIVSERFRTSFKRACQRYMCGGGWCFGGGGGDQYSLAPFRQWSSRSVVNTAAHRFGSDKSKATKQDSLQGGGGGTGTGAAGTPCSKQPTPNNSVKTLERDQSGANGVAMVLAKKQLLKLNGSGPAIVVRGENGGASASGRRPSWVFWASANGAGKAPFHFRRPFFARKSTGNEDEESSTAVLGAPEPTLTTGTNTLQTPTDPMAAVVHSGSTTFENGELVENGRVPAPAKFFISAKSSVSFSSSTGGDMVPPLAQQEPSETPKNFTKHQLFISIPGATEGALEDSSGGESDVVLL